VSVVSAVTKNT